MHRSSIAAAWGLPSEAVGVAQTTQYRPRLAVALRWGVAEVIVTRKWGPNLYDVDVNRCGFIFPFAWRSHRIGSRVHPDTWRWCEVHVVVVGCGRVGSGLAATLVEQGHTVSVIDRKATAFRRLPENFSGDTIVGVGFDRTRLRAAGIERADALAAVTNGDNSNILIARTAREFFHVDRVVARIYDQRRAAIYERLGISTVATVQWAIERVLRDGVEWVDPSARVCLVERVVPVSWAGRPLVDLEAEGRSRVVALTRLGVAQLVSPALLAQEGDIVWVAIDGDHIGEFDRHLASAPSQGGHH